MAVSNARKSSFIWADDVEDEAMSVTLKKSDIEPGDKPESILPVYRRPTPRNYLKRKPMGPCLVCYGAHLTFICLKDKAPSEVKSFVKEKRLCSNCFSHKHQIIDCQNKSRCLECGCKHHTLLHDETTLQDTNYDMLNHETETDTGTEAKAKAEAEKNDTETKIGTDPETESAFEPELDIEPKLKPEPDIESKLELEPEPELQPRHELELEPESELEPRLELEFETKLEHENQLDLETSGETEFESGTESEPEPEHQLELENELEPDHQLELENEPEPEQQLELETENELDHEIENEFESESEPEPKEKEQLEKHELQCDLEDDGNLEDSASEKGLAQQGSLNKIMGLCPMGLCPTISAIQEKVSHDHATPSRGADSPNWRGDFLVEEKRSHNSLGIQRVNALNDYCLWPSLKGDGGQGLEDAKSTWHPSHERVQEHGDGFPQIRRSKKSLQDLSSNGAYPHQRHGGGGSNPRPSGNGTLPKISGTLPKRNGTLPKSGTLPERYGTLPKSNGTLPNSGTFPAAGLCPTYHHQPQISYQSHPQNKNINEQRESLSDQQRGNQEENNTYFQDIKQHNRIKNQILREHKEFHQVAWIHWIPELTLLDLNVPKGAQSVAEQLCTTLSTFDIDPIHKLTYLLAAIEDPTLQRAIRCGGFPHNELGFLWAQDLLKRIFKELVSIWRTPTIALETYLEEDLSMCINCYSFLHKTQDCNSSPQCKSCFNMHSTLLHPLLAHQSKGPSEFIEENTHHAHQSNVKQEKTNQLDFHQPVKYSAFIIPVYAQNHQAKLAEETLMYLDSGSSFTWISTEVAEVLQLETITTINYNINTVNGNVRYENRPVVELDLQSLDGTENCKIRATVMDNIPQLPYPDLPQIKQMYHHLTNVPIESTKASRIGIFVGRDHCDLLIQRTIVEGGKNEPIAFQMKLGWTICVPVPEVSNGTIDFIEGYQKVNQPSNTKPLQYKDFKPVITILDRIKMKLKRVTSYLTPLQPTAVDYSRLYDN